jgi:hypothetical protein
MRGISLLHKLAQLVPNFHTAKGDRMYDVSITNNYIYSLFQDGGNQIIAGPNGGKAVLKNWGSHVLNVWGMGDINFIDIADKKLPEYTNPKLPWTNSTWGGIVRYMGIEAYFRYEGQGAVELVLDQYGSVSLHFPQGGMQISLPDLTVV